MKRVYAWEAIDGSVHKSRADAAVRDRAVRNARAARLEIEKATSHVFLFLADDDDEWCPHERRYIRRRTGRLPAGCDRADGLITYARETSAGLPIDAAIERMKRRCESLCRRTGLDWHIDRDVQEMHGGKEVGTLDIGDHPMMSDSVYLA